MSILCRLGWHKWKSDNISGTIEKGMLLRHCKKCQMRQLWDTDTSRRKGKRVKITNIRAEDYIKYLSYYVCTKGEVE